MERLATMLEGDGERPIASGDGAVRAEVTKGIVIDARAAEEELFNERRDEIQR